MAKAKSWVITTSGKRPIGEIARDLVKAGLKNRHVLEEVGIVTGEAGETAAAKFRAVEGVADVAPDVPVDIGPPDSTKTW